LVHRGATVAPLVGITLGDGWSRVLQEAKPTEHLFAAENLDTLMARGGRVRKRGEDQNLIGACDAEQPLNAFYVAGKDGTLEPIGENRLLALPPCIALILGAAEMRVS